MKRLRHAVLLSALATGVWLATGCADLRSMDSAAQASAAAASAAPPGALPVSPATAKPVTVTAAPSAAAAASGQVAARAAANADESAQAAGANPAQAVAPPASSASSGAAPAAASATEGDAEQASQLTGLVPKLTVKAPEPLKQLLENYLDLQRAAALPTAQQISNIEWSRLIAALPAQAEDLARTEGYFSANAVVTREPEAAGQPPRITLNVDTGPRARVGRVTLEVQGPLAEQAEAGTAGAAEAQQVRDALKRDWALATDAEFSADAWTDAKNSTLAQLRAAGYAAASWSGTAAEVDEGEHRVRLFVVADSGPLYRAGDFEISGLVHHQPEQVRGMAGFPRGATLTENRLQEFQERLSKAGLFDQVTVTMDPDPAQADHATVQVHLKETPLQSAVTALGVSATSGPRTTLEYTHRRVFGFALTSRNKLEWGRNRQAYDGEVSTHPDERFSRDLVGASVERLWTDDDMVLSQRLRLGRSLEKPKFDRLNYVEAERAVECVRDSGVLIDCDKLAALSANTHNTWREVDNVLLPTEGYTLATEFGGGLADGSASKRGVFARAYGRATGYWPVGSWYTQARLELGKVFTPAGVQVPDSQRFRAGGDNSVRGYPWRTLAPATADGGVTGGRLLFTSSVEAAHPIVASLPSVWGAVFIDAGRAADQLPALKPALGYGLGVRWRSPVGPLSLDWAWGQELHRGRIHLNVGVAF
ncbi:autotransporter assembly complex family protein [Ideonella sp.]|uniref:autotransporter assembly complex protein TamA n=1 Tax=Ideonella sp. TaxID=1929293 RepID=UPI002BC45E1E|nr:BamA/TamA family outer membrane protein [Ramlibacter sp.]